MESPRYLPEAEFDVQLVDPSEAELEALMVPELGLKVDDDLLPAPPLAEASPDPEEVSLPKTMAPCLVEGCTGVNLRSELRRFQHWHYRHVPGHHRFWCPASSCRKVTRKPRDIRGHMRKAHGLATPETLSLTFIDRKISPNPQYKDPGPCPAPTWVYPMDKTGGWQPPYL